MGWTSNNYLYSPVLNESYETGGVPFENGFERVDKKLSEVLSVGDPDFGNTISDALSYIGDKYRRLRIPPGTYELPKVIPANVELDVMPGATLINPNISIDVEGLSIATTCVVTYRSHGLSTGDRIKISGITQTGWEALNNRIFSIIKIDDNSFRIYFNSSTFSTYDPIVDAGKITKAACNFRGKVLAGRYNIFSTTDGFVTFWMNDEVYPEWWGAKSDNITPSNAAIQAAIDAVAFGVSDIRAGRTSQVVSLAPGGYLFIKRVNLRPGVTLQGAGINTWILLGKTFPTSKVDGYAAFALAESTKADPHRPYTYTLLQDLLIYLYDAPDECRGIWINKSSWKSAWRNLSFKCINPNRPHGGIHVSESEYDENGNILSHAIHDDSIYSNIYFHYLCSSDGAFWVEDTDDFQQCWLEHFNFYACTLNAQFGGCNSYLVHWNNNPVQYPLLSDGSGGVNPRILLTNGAGSPNTFISCYWDVSNTHVNVLYAGNNNVAYETEAYKFMGHQPGMGSYSNVWDIVGYKKLSIKYVDQTTIKYDGDIEHWIVPGITIYSLKGDELITKHIVITSIYNTDNNETIITISGSSFNLEVTQIYRIYEPTRITDSQCTVKGNVYNHPIMIVFGNKGIIQAEWAPISPATRGISKKLTISGTPVYDPKTKLTTISITTNDFTANPAKLNRFTLYRQCSMYCGIVQSGPEMLTLKADKLTIGLNNAGSELRQVLKGTISTNLGTISAGSTSDQLINIAGVQATSFVSVSAAGKLPNGIKIDYCYGVSGAIHLVVTNNSGSAWTPGALNWNYLVIN